MCILLRRENDNGEIVWNGIRCVEILGYHYIIPEKRMLFYLNLENLIKNNYLEILHIGNTSLVIKEPSPLLKHIDEPNEINLFGSVFQEKMGLSWPQDDMKKPEVCVEPVFSQISQSEDYFPFMIWNIGPFSNIGPVNIALELTFSGDTFNKLINDRTLYSVDGPEPLLTTIRQNLIPYSDYSEDIKSKAQEHLKKFDNYIDFSLGYDLIFINQPKADNIDPIYYTSSVYKAKMQPEPQGVAERFVTANPFYQIVLKNNRKEKDKTEEKQAG